MSDGTLTVVTVVRNDQVGLERTLASIDAQTVAIFDVVVIDGGSTDGTADTALRYSERSNFQVVSEPDHGIYDAMNKGLSHAKGTYVLFLNAGDVFADAEVMADFGCVVERNGYPSIIAARTRCLGYLGQPDRVSENIPYVGWRHILGLQMHAHPSTFARTELLRLLGGFPCQHSVAADYHLLMRACLASPPFEWYREVAHFSPGGASYLAAERMPKLLSAVRREVFRLDGKVGVLDRLWTAAFGLNYRRHLERGRRS